MKLSINKILLFIVLITDIFVLYVLYKMIPNHYIIFIFLCLLLTITKYPLYELIFITINRKYCVWSIWSLLFSIIFEVIINTSVFIGFFTGNIGTANIIKFISSLFTLGIKCFLMFNIFVMKNFLLFNVNVPASAGDFNMFGK
ncbi:hypothetical protein H312_01637 [Anncaliia algerae PRA339]|uniref:Uncharacterized protein n=1 Tax=Anncaliia algerae PRA339 TaxID=1288291 RepID=A0A059F1A6_9MICR|nr:hypothetical protein H312_01633 [Anncaliia algerae PRA339]KCZ80950.1 hypothetical protein H312_01637 [Anncaliia algerae PRA339]